MRKIKAQWPAFSCSLCKVHDLWTLFMDLDCHSHCLRWSSVFTEEASRGAISTAAVWCVWVCVCVGVCVHACVHVWVCTVCMCVCVCVCACVHTFDPRCPVNGSVPWRPPSERSRLEQDKTHCVYSGHKCDTAGRSGTVSHQLWSRYRPRVHDSGRGDSYPAHA